MKTSIKYLIIDIDESICDTPKFDTLLEFQQAEHKKFKPIKPVLNIVQTYIDSGKFHPLFLTARCETLLSVTDYWLNKHLNLQNIKYSLCMRPFDDYRESAHLKLGILKQRIIRPKHVVLWIDDDVTTITLANNEGYHIKHPKELEV